MKIYNKLAVCAGVLIAFIVLSTGTARAEQSVDKIRIIGTLPLKHYATQALKNFKKDVEKGTDNKLRVDIFPASQLYNDVDAVKVLPTGAVDMGVVLLDWWTGLVPSAGILYMPTYYEDVEHYYAVRDMASPVLGKDLEKKGNVKLLGWFDYDAEALISKEQILKMDDFKNTKLRGYGQYAATFLQAVGSSPVVMSSTEAYDAMAKGTIDGSMSGPTSHLDRKFYEVAKYLITQPSFIQPVLSYAIVVNLDTWKKLTPEMQKSIEAASRNMETSSREVVLKNSAKAVETLKEKGITIVDQLDPDEFDRIKKKVWPALEKKYLDQVGTAEAQPILDQVSNLRKKH